MNKVDASLAGLSYAKKTPVATSDFHENQSSWRKELEKQMYSELPKSNAEKNNLPEQKNNTALLDEFANTKKELETKSAVNNVADSKARLDHRDVGASHYKEPITKEIKVSSLLPQYKALATILNATNDIKQPLIGSKSASESGLIREQRPFQPLNEVQKFNVKLLADGELVVRDVVTGNLNKKQIDSLVNELKRVFEKDIHKLKLNGDVVWEAKVADKADERYIIDMVY